MVPFSGFTCGRLSLDFDPTLALLLLMRATLGALHLVSAFRSESVKVFSSLQTRNILFVGAIRVERRATLGAPDGAPDGA